MTSGSPARAHEQLLSERLHEVEAHAHARGGSGVARVHVLGPDPEHDAPARAGGQRPLPIPGET